MPFRKLLNILHRSKKSSTHFSEIDVTDAYTYIPLQPEQIRLVVIPPQANFDQLVVDISVEQLDSTNNYNAVSYCWGSHEKPHSIICRNVTSRFRDSPLYDPKSKGYISVGRLPVTENLYQMLREFGRPDSYGIFWIDAICVNQADVLEKTAQVSMMHRIYSNAAATVLYAGHSDDSTVKAFQCARLLRELKDVESNELTRVFRQGYSGFITPDGEEFDSALLEAFSSLICRDWFKRAWIMQEIVMSPRRTLFCGKISISWDEIFEACKVIMKNPALNLLANYPGQPECNRIVNSHGWWEIWIHLNRVNSGLPPPEGMTREEMEKQSASALAFLTVLIVGRDLMASDPRDKVFALSNIVFGYSRKQMPKIDYSISAAEVYTRTSIGLGTHHPGLQFLNCVQFPADTPNLPSWVADWSQPWQTEVLGFRDLKAGGEASYNADFPEIPTPFSLPLHLTCKGMVLMAISATSPRLQSDNDLMRLQIDTRLQDNYPATSEKYCKVITNIIGLNVSKIAEISVETHEGAFWSYKKTFSLNFVSKNSGNISSKPQSPSSLGDQTENANLYEMRKRMEDVAIFEGPFLRNRQFMISDLGFLGIIPPAAKPEDSIGLFLGATTPFVIRKKENGSYTLIGECYVYGIMNGEAIDDAPAESIQKIVLE
jgi:hypothetical protein